MSEDQRTGEEGNLLFEQLVKVKLDSGEDALSAWNAQADREKLAAELENRELDRQTQELREDLARTQA